LTELATPAALVATVAICVADGFAGSALTALESAFTDVLTALVSLGKSLLALLTSYVASLWIVLTCDCRPLMMPLNLRLVTPLIEFSKLVRSEQ
jgi:hypothetical protein